MRDGAVRIRERRQLRFAVVVQVAHPAVLAAAQANRAPHLLLAVRLASIVPADLLAVFHVTRGDHLHGVFTGTDSNSHLRVGFTAVRRAREHRPFDHAVDEEHVVPSRVRAVPLHRGVVKRGNLVVPSDVPADRLRGCFFFEPSPSRVQFAAVRAKVFTLLDSFRFDHHQADTLGLGLVLLAVLGAQFGEGLGAVFDFVCRRFIVCDCLRGCFDGDDAAVHRGESHRLRHQVHEVILLARLDGCREVLHDLLARVRVEALELDHGDVLARYDPFRRFTHRRVFVVFLGILRALALFLRGELGSRAEAVDGILGVRRVDLLGVNVPRDELDDAGDDHLAFAIGAGVAELRGVVDAFFRRGSGARGADELLLGELVGLARDVSGRVRVAGCALGLRRLLDGCELGHDRLDVLVVVGVADVHRRVGLGVAAAVPARHPA